MGLIKCKPFKRKGLKCSNQEKFFTNRQAYVYAGCTLGTPPYEAVKQLFIYYMKP